MKDLVLVEKKQNTFIYGRIVDGKNKLGQYDVYVGMTKKNATPYALVSDAQQHRNKLIAE